eukprot:gene3048-5220_t
MFDSISHHLDEDEIDNFKKHSKNELETIKEEKENNNQKEKILTTDEIEIITNHPNSQPLNIPATELTFILQEENPMSRFNIQPKKEYSNFFEKKIELKDLPMYPTPLQKIFVNLKEKKEKRNTILSKTFCVILYFEEFSPIKKRDILILEKVKESLENEEYQVVGGFLIPIFDSKNCDLKKRIEMCKMISNESSWIETDEYYSELNESKDQLEVILHLKNLFQKYFQNEHDELKIMNINLSSDSTSSNSLSDGIESVILYKENIDRIYGNHYLKFLKEFENEEVDEKIEK